MLGFFYRFSSAGNLLFGLRKHLQSVDYSEHELMYPMYQLSILVILLTVSCAHLAMLSL